jgi:hypothetical protein
VTEPTSRLLDVLIVGAGVSGLSCAATLLKSGADLAVVEQSRGVGGRCATWRADDGQPLDYGVTFLHGTEPDFCAQIAGVEGATVLPGWPERVHGHGVPCQPRAFGRRERRFAYVEGLSVWPKQLARGLPVHLRARVTSLGLEGGAVTARCEDGRSFVARDVVLSAPCEQMLGMLDRWTEAAVALEGPRGLLRMLGTVPCLTLLVTYPADAPEPGWHVLFPEESEVLLLVSNEGSKRPASSGRALVLQARAGWSREHIDDPPERFARAMLQEAARLLGPWAASPSWSRAHCWRQARTELSSELCGPMLLPLGAGVRLGLTGELFARGAGVEAAWSSGRLLGRRLAEEARS